MQSYSHRQTKYAPAQLYILRLAILNMAFHILIEKLSETDSDATFRFFDSAYPNEVGELRLDKQAESISMTKYTREAFFARAARKVAIAYKSGNLPELLEWTS